MQPKNIIDKIWDTHVVIHKPGHPAVLAIDLMLMHEVTSAQAFQALRDRGLPVFDPGRLMATLDHSVPTRSNRFEIYDEAARIQVETMRNNALTNGIPLLDFDKGQGVVHVVGPELGATQPGMTIVCGDSHTSTHGAFGALAFGIGTSEVGNVLATGCLLQQKPRSMRVEFSGKLSKGVYAKDAILALIAQIGIGGANGHVVEYTGEAIRSMTMEERMTVCNMSIECGARAGLIGPDETTLSYLIERPFAPSHDDWESAVALWSSLVSDQGASYHKEVNIAVDALKPMITWGTNPEQAIPINGTIPTINTLPKTHQAVAHQALEYIGLKEGMPIQGVPITWAFVGSCTNGRIEDLRIAAQVLRGRKVHEQVKLFVVPGSESVRATALAEGLDRVFLESGAEFRMPGCSMCLGMNDDKVPPGERCISSSNRNFVGRQGPGSRTHLASPATVAASAIAGCISSAEQYL